MIHVDELILILAWTVLGCILIVALVIGLLNHFGILKK